MSYTFEAELYGLTLEVEGEFSPAEPETLTDPGWAPSFEIDILKIEGKVFDVSMLTENTISTIEGIAFDKL